MTRSETSTIRIAVACHIQPNSPRAMSEFFVCLFCAAQIIGLLTFGLLLPLPWKLFLEEGMKIVDFSKNNWFSEVLDGHLLSFHICLASCINWRQHHAFFSTCFLWNKDCELCCSDLLPKNVCDKALSILHATQQTSSGSLFLHHTATKRTSKISHFDCPILCSSAHQLPGKGSGERKSAKQHQAPILSKNLF